MSSSYLLLHKEVMPLPDHCRQKLSRGPKQTCQHTTCTVKVAGEFWEVQCKNTTEMFKDLENEDEGKLVDCVKINEHIEIKSQKVQIYS